MELATSQPIVSRMVRAAKLEVQLYEEVEADTTATTQALLVVVLAALASGIGQLVGASLLGLGGGGLIGGLVRGILLVLVSWAVWSYALYLVGTKLFGGVATYGELLRTLGFAQSVGVLHIFGFIPILGWLVSLAVGIWTLVAFFVGARQALDLDNGKTAITILVAFIPAIIVVAIIYSLLGSIFGLR